MPTYDYVCRDCGYEFEAFQSMKDDALTECPSCEGSIKRKVGGGAGIIFKGSGFYINDSKKAETKTETKPAESKPAAVPAAT